MTERLYDPSLRFVLCVSGVASDGQGIELPSVMNLPLKPRVLDRHIASKIIRPILSSMPSCLHESGFSSHPVAQSLVSDWTELSSQPPTQEARQEHTWCGKAEEQDAFCAGSGLRTFLVLVLLALSLDPIPPRFGFVHLLDTRMQFLGLKHLRFEREAS